MLLHDGIELQKFYLAQQGEKIVEIGQKIVKFGQKNFLFYGTRDDIFM